MIKKNILLTIGFLTSAALSQLSFTCNVFSGEMINNSGRPVHRFICLCEGKNGDHNASTNCLKSSSDDQCSTSDFYPTGSNFRIKISNCTAETASVIFRDGTIDYEAEFKLNCTESDKKKECVGSKTIH